jgi:hypothetical protein
MRLSPASDCLVVHHLPFKVGDLTCKTRRQARLFPIRARSRYGGQLLAMAAIGSLLSVREKRQLDAQLMRAWKKAVAGGSADGPREAGGG